jgi:RNA-splicing ligase RtcB
MAQVRFDEPISCHHNYVAEETYDGVELLVTRKGAIRRRSAPETSTATSRPSKSTASTTIYRIPGR